MTGISKIAQTLTMRHGLRRDYSSPRMALSYSLPVNSYPHCQRHCLSTAPISSSSRAGIPPFKVTFLRRERLNLPVGPATLSPGISSELLSPPSFLSLPENKTYISESASRHPHTSYLPKSEHTTLPNPSDPLARSNQLFPILVNSALRGL